jgi:hypothetical protein
MLYGIESKIQMMKFIVPNLLQSFNIYFSSVCLKHRSLLLKKISMNECLWITGGRILTGCNGSSLSVILYSTKPAWNGLSLILGLRDDIPPTKLLSHSMAQQFLLHCNLKEKKLHSANV